MKSKLLFLVCLCSVAWIGLPACNGSAPNTAAGSVSALTNGVDDDADGQVDERGEGQDEDEDGKVDEANEDKDACPVQAEHRRHYNESAGAPAQQPTHNHSGMQAGHGAGEMDEDNEVDEDCMSGAAGSDAENEAPATTPKPDAG